MHTTATAIPALSLIVPMHNEQEALPLFFAAAIPMLTKLDISYEVIYVNDGSHDKTLEIALEHRKKKPAYKNY